jgi:hypothetical protein
MYASSGIEPTAPQIYIYGFVAYNCSEVIHHDPQRLDTLPLGSQPITNKPIRCPENNEIDSWYEFTS